MLYQYGGLSTEDSVRSSYVELVEVGRVSLVAHNRYHGGVDLVTELWCTPPGSDIPSCNACGTILQILVTTLLPRRTWD
jgi:hypothetical protein